MKLEPLRALIQTRAEYLAAADILYGLAERELCVFDPDLSMLELNAPIRIEVLRDFLRGNSERQLRIALHSTEQVQSNCPRLLQLVREFSPRVSIYRTEGVATRAQDRFILADKGHFVRRPVAEQGRGVYGLHSEKEAQPLHDRFEEIWDASALAISATTLGL